jgi:phage shock protein PspC (stress-responsive transcriptional regulator)
MDTTDTLHTHRALVRPKEERWLGGVAAGLGRYFDLNPAVYRIAFVALAFAGGTGILLYLAAWLVIPEEGAADSIAASELRKHRDHPRRLIGLAVLATIGLAVLSSIHVWPSPGNVWVLAAIVIAGLAWWRGRLVLGLLAGLAVVVVAGVLLAVSVPVFSGVGNRSYEDLHSKYTLGIGKLTVDLSGQQLPRGETFVKATVGIGDLHVIAPSDATVEVDGHVQAGNLVVLGHRDDGTHVQAHIIDRTGSGRVLVLDLRTGLGDVKVDRG